MHNKEKIKSKIIKKPLSMVFGWVIDYIVEDIKKLPPGSVMLEMGTFVGGSTRLFSLANPNIIIHTIDLNNFAEIDQDSMQPMIEYIRNDLEEPNLSIDDLIEIQKMHLEDCANVIRHTGNSRDLLLNQIDLVFVDAGHEYNNVLPDLRYSWNILKEGGYIFGDDIQSPGIYNAVNEFCREVDVPFTIYSKCFKIQKHLGQNSEVRQLIEKNIFTDFVLPVDNKS